MVCENLNDNLFSVGRLCDAGFSVGFTSHACYVFTGESFKGKPVCQQARDTKTGLYPIFLVESEDCRPMLLPGDRGEVHGASVVKIDDVRKHFGQLTQWAETKLVEGRGAKVGPWLRIQFKDFEGSLVHLLV